MYSSFAHVLQLPPSRSVPTDHVNCSFLTSLHCDGSDGFRRSGEHKTIHCTVSCFNNFLSTYQSVTIFHNAGVQHSTSKPSSTNHLDLQIKLRFHDVFSMTHELGQQPSRFVCHRSTQLKLEGVENNRQHTMDTVRKNTDSNIEAIHHLFLELSGSSGTRVHHVSGVHKNGPRSFQICLTLETSRFFNTWRSHAALFRNIEFSTLSNFCHGDSLVKLVTVITFQTCDGCHASEFPFTSSIHCTSFKLVMDCVFLEFMCFRAFSGDYCQRFPRGSPRNRIATIRIRIGIGIS